MNTLIPLVSDIALLVLISSFWELLAPRGKLRQMVRLVIGLLLVSFIIVPISDLLQRGAPEILIDFPAVADSTNMLNEGAALATSLEDIARRQYEAELARQVAALALLVDGVADLKVALAVAEHSGFITQLYLEVELLPGAEAAVVKPRLANLISVFYGLEENLLEIIIKGVSE